MTTQENQTKCYVNVHFVVPDYYESENDCGVTMWQAFNKCIELGLQPEWITEKLCNKLLPSKNDVFIIEEFKGDLFEKLKNFRCSIVSPKCLLICFDNGEPIPEGKSPIYTTAMKGICVCASGLSPEIKDQIQQRVEYMGGFFTKQLRNSVTHLVANSVMSAKYEGAIEMKIPIMTKEWVDAVWETNLKEVVKADNKIFDKYECPVFMNLVATSTNLSKRRKEEIKHLIHDHGGTFIGPLDGTKVRVVLSYENGPMSDKLKYAMDNDIACLKLDWIYESIKVGYALPFRNFIIKSGKACSTPETPDARVTLNCSEISSIPYDKHHNNYVNESLCSTISNFSTVDTVTNNLYGNSSAASSNAVLNILSRLTLNEAKLAGPFLDGCNIYLAGFAVSIKDKLNRILNVGGATRLDDISDAVTHVIIGDENKAAVELKIIKSRNLCPYILNTEWLEVSMKLKRPAQEDCFLFEAKNDAAKKDVEAPASPLIKKNLQMLQQSKRPPVPPFNLEKENAPTNEEQPNLVQQYLQETVECNSTTQEFIKPRHTSMLEDKEQEKLDNTKKTNQAFSSGKMCVNKLESDTTVPVSQNYTIDEKLFDGLTFIMVGFNNEDKNGHEDMIITSGGRVVSRTYNGIPDYGIVPIHGASLKQTVNNIVTDLYITDCINKGQIIDIMYYHKPLSIRKSCNPLSECVITMSMYTGTERMYLSMLATKLGAICQDMFARKANAEKNTQGSTHLVCPTPEGNKYNAAVRWKLPAVTADWLKACADQLVLVDETPFLIGETIVPDRSISNSTNRINPSNFQESNMNLTEETTMRKASALKRHLCEVKDQEAISTSTPLINKRLSLAINKTPQSPFHVSTPESPYGQVFKPCPSPETRKGLIKWVNNFPDFQVPEPPLKRRAPSTPLSQLKRQLWEKVKNQVQSEKEDISNKLSTKPEDNSFMERIKEKKDDQSNKDGSSTSTPINRKLNFNEENTPVANKSSDGINMQIVQLEQVLERTSSTPENRYSSPGENVKRYDEEAPDYIRECMVKDSQTNETIVWEYPGCSKQLTLNKCTSKENKNDMNEIKEREQLDTVTEYECETSSIRKFMLSGIKDRNAYERVIRELGGDVSTDANFDNSATHLLCIRPSRNEKMLGSIASGKWILHCSYLRDCEQENKFLDEEKYEWGNPKSKDMIPEPNGEIEQAIAIAAYRWRLKLQKELYGPFSDINALLMVSEEKYDQFKRLIEAGGGSVIQARPPYEASPSGRKITHCFVNVRQVNQPVDWAMLASKGILCFLPQYLSDYLTAKTLLIPRDCVLPEFKKYLTLLPK